MGLAAYKRIIITEGATSLARGIEHLYLMNGTHTVHYQYELKQDGEVELYQVQLFCPELFDLTVTKKQQFFEAVSEEELKAIFRAECRMITRARNKMRGKSLS